MNTVLPSLEGTVMHFQPFGFSPVFELFIYVSDLFLVLHLRVISTRPLVNLLGALHFATVQLKVLFL